MYIIYSRINKNRTSVKKHLIMLNYFCRFSALIERNNIFNVIAIENKKSGAFCHTKFLTFSSTIWHTDQYCYFHSNIKYLPMFICYINLCQHRLYIFIKTNNFRSYSTPTTLLYMRLLAIVGSISAGVIVITNYIKSWSYALSWILQNFFLEEKLKCTGVFNLKLRFCLTLSQYIKQRVHLTIIIPNK